MATSWKKRLAFVPPVVLGVAVLAFAASTKKGPVQTPPTELAKVVRVIEVVKVPVIARAIGYGSVTPGSVWNAVSKVSGTAVMVHSGFKKGSILPKGTELVRIDPTDYQLTIAQFEANIRATDAQLQENKVTEANTRASLEIEENVLAIKKRDLARKEALRKKGAASVSSVDGARRDVLSQQQQVRTLTNSLALIPTQRRVLEEQKAVYRAQLQDANHDLARTSIFLPFDARIADASVEISQHVQSGQTLGVADAIGVSEVQAQVPLARFRTVIGGLDNQNRPFAVADLTKLADMLNLSATIRLKSGDFTPEWQGRVVRISDTMDPQTRTVGVIVAVDKPYATAVPGQRPPLAKGMFVEVELPSPRPLHAMVVPRAAVHGNQVYVVDRENRLAFKTVKTAFSQGNFVVVTGGLTVGDQVVVSDVVPAVEGLLLRPQVDQALQQSVIFEAGENGVAK